jgi:hypothetical protein
LLSSIDNALVLYVVTPSVLPNGPVIYLLSKDEAALYLHSFEQKKVDVLLFFVLDLPLTNILLQKLQL